MADFYALHSEENGAGWCFCSAWWVPTWDAWGERTAQENRDVRASLCARGQFDGCLLYVDGAPVAWCQIGPRDRLTKLVRQFGLRADPGVWAITCFLVAPPARRSGHARRLLSAACEYAREGGARRIEAFPKRGEDLGDHDLWTGPEALYRSAGFRTEREDPGRPIYVLELQDA